MCLGSYLSYNSTATQAPYRCFVLCRTIEVFRPCQHQESMHPPCMPVCHHGGTGNLQYSEEYMLISLEDTTVTHLTSYLTTSAWRRLNFSNTWGFFSIQLSWSNLMTSICTYTKARKLLGLLYHRFYKHAEPSALFQLYLSLVRPHQVMYGTPTYKKT